MTKHLVLPLSCLLLGVVSGYGLRSIGGNDKDTKAPSAGIKDPSNPRPSSRAGANDADIEKTPSAAHRTPKKAAEISLENQMKDLLVDFDVKSAHKAAVKLSVSELQSALALVANLPKSADRDSLRAQLFRAWAAKDPDAAWQAALADPIEKSKGNLLGIVAGEIAKSNPAAALTLAQSLGMGERRSKVIESVFSEWSKVDVAAAINYSNAHPEQPVDTFVFSRGLTTLAEKDPLKAANLCVIFKEDMKRKIALSHVMNAWVEVDPLAALHWAEEVSNPNMKPDAIAAAVGAWAKIDPAAALAQVQKISDATTRANSFKKAWSDWFRSNPAAATSYLAGTTDENLTQNVTFDFTYFSESYPPKERAALLAQIPEGKLKTDLLRKVTDSQIGKGQFNEALQMLNGMPDSPDRDRSVVKLGQAWAATDLDAAVKWLKPQPDSTDRDLAVAGFVGTLARTDPPGALEWVKSIPDEKVRQGALKNVAVQWLKSDPAKAEAWMAAVREFSELDKKMIHTFASFRSDYIPMSFTVGNRR